MQILFILRYISPTKSRRKHCVEKAQPALSGKTFPKITEEKGAVYTPPHLLFCTHSPQPSTHTPLQHGSTLLRHVEQWATTCRRWRSATGCGWTWHTYPKKAKGEKSMSGGFFSPEMVVPLAAVITPLKSSAAHTVPEVRTAPSKCKQCRAVANSFCLVNHTASSSSWTCVFCRSRNLLSCPPDQMSAEFTEGVNTVEYLLPASPGRAPTFIFIVDVATNAEELQGEKESLLATIPRLPPGSLVGLITLGKYVTVWDLGSGGVNSTVFTGLPAGGTYSVDTVRDYLSIKRAGRGGDDGLQGRVLVGGAEAQPAIVSILEDLTPDPWAVKPRLRQMRSTGASLEVAVGIAELLSGQDVCCAVVRVLLPCGGGVGRGGGGLLARCFVYYRQFSVALEGLGGGFAFYSCGQEGCVVSCCVVLCGAGFVCAHPGELSSG